MEIHASANSGQLFQFHLGVGTLGRLFWELSASKNKPFVVLIATLTNLPAQHQGFSRHKCPEFYSLINPKIYPTSKAYKSGAKPRISGTNSAEYSHWLNYKAVILLLYRNFPRSTFHPSFHLSYGFRHKEKRRKQSRCFLLIKP